MVAPMDAGHGGTEVWLLYLRDASSAGSLEDHDPNSGSEEVQSQMGQPPKSSRRNFIPYSTVVICLLRLACCRPMQTPPTASPTPG